MINNKSKNLQGPVLLVCVYNRFGNIITHDYLYQIFSPYGEIVKILIFQKAKVWKTFIQFQYPDSAYQALIQLNNKIIFQDGSKMNIFHSKLKHVQFQNDNLGGVNYQNLKNIGQYKYQHQHQLNNQYHLESQVPRKRNSTFQDHFSQAHENNMTKFVKFQYFQQNKNSSKYQNFKIYQDQNSLINNDKNNLLIELQKQQKKSNRPQSQKHIQLYCLQNSDSTFHRSQTRNSKKSFGGGSFNNFGDIDDLFRQIALQSDQFRQWKQTQLNNNRKKSKTIVNPLSEQFLIENCPSKVIFIRSIPQNYSHQCIYNIFINFGSISRMIVMKEKLSALIQYEQIYQAIRAKDQINYIKTDLKIFYSHYQSLILRKDCQNQLNFQYKLQQNTKTYSNSNHSQSNKKKPFNPPSQVLYLTMITPNMQNQLIKKCLQIGCKIKDIEWKQNGKDKWMCLVQFNNMNDSLQALGMLQNVLMSNGKKLKITFTRSKLSEKSNQYQYQQKQSHYYNQQQNTKNQFIYSNKDSKQIIQKKN